MGRRAKDHLPPARCQSVIAHNLKLLIDGRYGTAKSITAAYKAVAKDAHTTLSQVQRAVSGDAAIGVDMLERFADALKVRTADLLIDGAFAARKPVMESSSGGDMTGELQRRRR